MALGTSRVQPLRPLVLALLATALLAAAILVAACGSSGGGGAAPSATGGADTTPATFAVTDAVTGLGQVTDLAFLPDGRIVITEKDGAVKLRRADGAVVVAGRYDVDTASEKGLLGVAVDPAFAQTGRIFLYVSWADTAGGTDLDRHRVVSVPLAGDALDRAQERVLVRGLRGPANHDGGGLAVGPDGRLYVGVGDTGCNSGAPPGQPPTNFFATCLSNANGKILRVNVDGSIPDDNPLAGVASVTACGDTCGASPPGLAAPRRELWAWGFRNPWRFAFDAATGLLWVADVGEQTAEEVDVVRPGKHYGWPFREGASGFPVSKCREFGLGDDCAEPVYVCTHAAGPDGGCESITGGPIVDTASWPASERGRYWFADNVTGRVFSLALNSARDGVVPGSRREVARIADGLPVSMRLGPEGDVWVAVLAGKIVRVAPQR